MNVKGLTLLSRVPVRFLGAASVSQPGSAEQLVRTTSLWAALRAVYGFFEPL
jgi:hypothetical protein